MPIMLRMVFIAVIGSGVVPYLKGLGFACA